jgi:hypothetical protein
VTAYDIALWAVLGAATVIAIGELYFSTSDIEDWSLYADEAEDEADDFAAWAEWNNRP